MIELLDKRQIPEFREDISKRPLNMEIEDFDFARFTHQGFPCIVRRGLWTGAWCGYVGVGKSHPFFKKGYSNELLNDIRVHGGLTFASPCFEDGEVGICHPDDGNDERFWFGFDCAHAGDYIPVAYREVKFMEALNALFGHRADQYRDIDYVVGETKRLADQFHKVESVA